MMYMPIIDINKPSGLELFRQYMDKKIVPLAYEVCWQQETVFDIIVSYVADSAFSCSSPVNGTVVAEDKYTVGC